MESLRLSRLYGQEGARQMLSMALSMSGAAADARLTLIWKSAPCFAGGVHISALQSGRSFGQRTKRQCGITRLAGGALILLRISWRIK